MLYLAILCRLSDSVKSPKRGGNECLVVEIHMSLPVSDITARLLHMLSVKDVANRLGLSEWGARRLLYACKPLLDGLQAHGSHGEWLISPQAIGMLERAKDLRTQGIRLQEICSRLAAEMPDHSNGSVAMQVQTSASQEQGNVQALTKALEQQVEYLKSENTWLRNKLDETLAKVPALPAPKTEAKDALQVSRLQALRIALLGR